MRPQDVAHAFGGDDAPRVTAQPGDRTAREALVGHRFVPDDLLPLGLGRDARQLRGQAQAGEAVDQRRIDHLIGVIEHARRIEDPAVEVHLLDGAEQEGTARRRATRADAELLEAAPERVEVLLRSGEDAARAARQPLVDEGDRPLVLLLVAFERQAHVTAVPNIGPDDR